MSAISNAIKAFFTTSANPYAGFTPFSSLGVAPGADVTIASGAKVLQDMTMTSPVGYITVAAGGIFKPDDRINTVTMAKGIRNSGGTMTWGTVAVPLLNNHTIELYDSLKAGAIRGPTHDASDVSTGNDGSVLNDDGGIRRGIITEDNSTTSFVGFVQGDETQARLNINAAAGAHDLYLDRVVYWKAGQRVLVSQTSFATSGDVTLVLTLAANTAGTNHLVTVEALASARWGSLQYAVDGVPGNAGDTGIRYTMSGETFVAMKADAIQTSNVIDQRAYVALVDRNVVIRGANDAQWATNGFGAVSMQMGNNSNRVTRQVLWERHGQRGLLGRYASHSHMCQVIGATGVVQTPGANWLSVDERCSYFNGENRARVIHGTQYATSKNNTSYRSKGHAFFLEDGSEENLTLWDDWSFDVQDPGVAMRLKAHDDNPSGHWWANLNNSIKRNVGIGGMRGWWNAPSYGLGNQANFATRLGGCLGASFRVPIWPFWGKQGVWEDNVGFCNAGAWGMSNDFPVFNNGGTTQGKIQTTDNGLPGGEYGNVHQVPTVMLRMQGFKAGLPYSNRISNPNYNNPITADIKREHLRGQTDQGFVRGAVAVMESLNVETYRPGITEQCQYKTDYHGTFPALDSSFWNFSGGTPQTCGTGGVADPLFQYWALATNCIKGGWDEYTDGVLGYALTGYLNSNKNWKRFKSNGYFHTPSNNLIGSTLLSGVSTLPGYATPDQTINGTVVRRHFFLNGANIDYFGAYEGVPMSYYIYDVPFLTLGAASPVAIAHDPYSKRTLTPYFAVHMYGDDSGANQYDFNAYRMSAQRLDPTTLAAVSGATWIGAGPGGDATNGTTQGALPFQHCAVPQAGWVHVDSREGVLNSIRFYTIIGAMWKRTAFGDDIDHWFGLSIPWNGAVVPTTVKTGYGGIAVSSVASKALLLSATDTRYWQDTVANRIYVKVYVPWGTTQGGPGGDNLHITVDA